jgi:signal transduction histidine kinase
VLLGRIRIRAKLAILVTIPLLAVVGLAIPVVVDRVDQADRASQTARSVRVAGQVGGLIQDLQQERLLAVASAFHLVDPGQVRKQVDTVTAHATELQATLGGGGVFVALNGISTMTDLRAAVLSGQAPMDHLVSTYSATIAKIIDSLQLEPTADVRTAEGRQVVALDAALRTDEGISIGAADLLIAVATKDPRAFVPYLTNLAALQAAAARFTSFATAAQTALYTQVTAELNARLGKDFAVTADVDPTPVIMRLTPQVALAGVQSLIGVGRVVEQKIVTDVTGEVNRQQRTALTTAGLVAGLALLVLLVVVLLCVAVGRAVARPLTRLTRSADRVARAAEAELTRVADDESEASAPLHLEPVDVRAQDEIGDLARAFERVQGTATRLVERQVLSRRNVAQMFGHVGRRTQNLVGRQIALIDRLERDEPDAERLQYLYRLDHVSSRLRRNAGSLVVLSGATGANEQHDPLPLADVIRLAMAEIEDYTRVDVDIPNGIALVPNVINDVVLVLAELMENATTFSPPHTRVSVYAQRSQYGAQLAVVDHGIGLSEHRLAEENARLARRERLDLAPTEVLGLFVVGRLARRHGLGVELAPTPGGGISALVTLPERLLTVPPPTVVTPIPVTSQPATVRTNGHGGPVPVLGAFDLEAVRRASQSIEAGGRWNAFGPAHYQSSPAAPPTQAPWTPPPPTQQPPVQRPPMAPTPVAGPPVAPPLRQRVPGTQIPEPLGQYLAATPAPADAANARALVDEFQAGIGRAEATLNPPPAAHGTAAPLSRRVPGATLDPNETAPIAGVLLQSGSMDPDQARQLVEQFESGVLRALREVRPEHE